MKKTTLGVMGAVALTLTANNAMALSITTSNDANALASLLGGSGISISGASLIGSTGQQGFFSNGLSSGIGIDAGVLLTSGSAVNALGPNGLTNTSTVTGTGNNTNLSAITGQPSFDQNVLAFDFTSTTGDLFFDYVFASEEYNEFVNASVNDVFAFFVDGVNIALIPGTSTAVSIDTVNLGTNSTFFNDNDTGNFNLEYDGFTNVFTASILGLSAGVHTIELAIADSGDSRYDSGVFIKAGSFTDANPQSVPEPGSIALLSLGLLGLVASKRRKKKN